MSQCLNRIRMDFDDNDVQQRVAFFLRTRHFAAFRNLDVAVQNGAVTVHGTVNSFYEKQVALNSCRRVAGVLTLVDEVEVQSSTQVHTSV